MTQRSYLRKVESEKDTLYRHELTIFKQASYPSQSEYVDGLEMRNQLEDYFPCYRIGEEEPRYTQFADLDD